MSIFTRTQSNAPGDLAEELAAAKAQYEATRTDVIDRAVARQNAINETIVELQDESAALNGVVGSA